MFCKKCGKELKDNSKFCPYCGNNLKKKPVKAVQKERKNNNSSPLVLTKKAKIGIAIGILVGAAALGVAIGFFLPQQELGNRKYTTGVSTETGMEKENLFSEEIDEKSMEEITINETVGQTNTNAKDAIPGEIPVTEPSASVDIVDNAELNIEAEVEQIRNWYYAVQEHLEKGVIPLDLGDGILGYYDGEVLEKIVVPEGVMSSEMVREYYFQDGKLYFVFAHGNGLEQRYYVKDGKLIRYIDENGVTHDTQLENYEAQYTRIYGEADFLLSAEQRGGM